MCEVGVLVLVVGGVIIGCYFVVVFVFGVDGVWIGLLWFVLCEFDVNLLMKEKLIELSVDDIFYLDCIFGYMMCMICCFWYVEWSCENVLLVLKLLL